MSTRSPGRSPRQSARRSMSRSRSRSRSPSKDLSPSETQNYGRGRLRSRSHSPGREFSLSPRHAGRRWPRDRSYTRSPTPESPKRSSKIVVEKLTKNVREGHLHDIFGTFGEIQSIDLPLNRTFMTNRGTAYILYYDAADAEVAVSSMHEAQVDGAVLKVSIVLPRRAFSRSPPPARRPAAEDRSFSPRRHPPSHGRHLPSRVSPPRRRSPRRHVNGGVSDRHDIYRPRSLSRSPSPRRSRARSYSPRSDSGSPPRRRSPVRRHSRHRRRRSPSYGSYSSRDSGVSERSRSPSRSRGPRSNNRRR